MWGGGGYAERQRTSGKRDRHLTDMTCEKDEKQKDQKRGETQ